MTLEKYYNEHWCKTPTEFKKVKFEELTNEQKKVLKDSFSFNAWVIQESGKQLAEEMRKEFGKIAETINRSFRFGKHR